MNRVATLTDAEFQIVQLVRGLMGDVENERTSSSDMHTRAELENVYNLLNNLDPTYWEETLHEVRERLYRLLH